MSLKQEYTYEFERFWKAYPRKVAKGAAYRAFQKLKLSPEDVEELVLHLEKRKRDDAKWVEGKFIPHAASFLNAHRWEDEYARVHRHWSRRPEFTREQPQEEIRRAPPEVISAELAKLKGLFH